MITIRRATVVAALTAAAAAAGPGVGMAAAAEELVVTAHGQCSAGSTFNLRAAETSQDEDHLAVRWYVDTDRSGASWRTTLTVAGEQAFAGVLRTASPSGDFSVRRLADVSDDHDEGIAHEVTARSVNTRTGEVCRAFIVYDDRELA